MSSFAHRRAILGLTVSLTALTVAATPALAQTVSTQSQSTNCPTGTALSPGGVCQPVLDAPATTPGNEDTPAETTTPGADDIVVTGSRVARPGDNSVAPVLVLDSKAIEARGFSTLGQALSEQPAFGISDNSPVGAQSGFGPGQTFVNFFGLGSQRTLTLVNGRRFVGSNTAAVFGPTGTGGSQVDLNLIPTKLIDRTETVAVGGAPIYGSDAISGTINVILKKNYQGLDLDAQYGIAEQGDNPDYRFRILAGHNFADGRGNLTFAGEYNESKGLLYTDRKLPNLGRYYDTPQSPDYPYVQQFYNDFRYPGLSATGLPLTGRVAYDVLGANTVFAPVYQTYISSLLGDGLPPFNPGVTGVGGAPTQALQFDNGGNLVPIDFGLPTSLVNSSGGSGYGFQNISNLITNTKRYSGILTGSYQITDNIRASGEAWYSHSEGTNLADQPEYYSGLLSEPGTPGGDIKISLANPYLAPAARAAIVDSINNNFLSDFNQGYTDNQDYFYLGRALTDLTTGRVRGQVDIVRFVGGFDGDFKVFGDKVWKWEVSGNYGRSTTRSVIPTINTQNFLNAVDAVGTSPANATCRPGVVSSPGPTISSTCAPINLFGNNVASQAARDYVTMLATPRSVNQQYDFEGSLTGPLVKLPGGDLSFALGYEHRDEHSTFDPSKAFLPDANGNGYGQSVPFAAIDAGYNTDEVFGELDADLIGPDNHIPLVRSLNLQLAGRYVDNSFNGNAFTYTAGGRWSPIRDLTIRGNFTHSIRSPSITEFANPPQNIFGFADDPCDRTAIANGPNPTARAANCTAALAAAGLTPAQIASFNALSDNRSFRQGIAGDTTLKNETANSYSVGAIIQPHFIPRLVISGDYINISVSKVISSFGADDTLSACYDSNTYPNVYCSRVSRDNLGQLSYIIQGYVNADQLKYRGIVAQGNYSLPTPFITAESSLGVGVSYQHLFELSSTTAGTKTRTDGTAGYSKNKFVASLYYDLPGFEYFAQASYIGPATPLLNVPANYREHNYYNAVVFVNMGVSFTVQERLKFQLNVDNIFNTEPPFPSSGSTDVYFRGTLGRYYRASAAIHF